MSIFGPFLGHSLCSAPCPCGAQACHWRTVCKRFKQINRGGSNEHFQTHLGRTPQSQSIPLNATMGYPITSETNLSISKTAKLVQTLVDLREDFNQELPGEIQECVNEVLNAQKKLVKTIDKFMHSRRRQVAEFEVVSSIIETCPEFLATKNNDRNEALPILRFAHSSDEEVASRYVPLLAEVGQKHRIGGKGARGGLLVKNAGGFIALKQIARIQSSSDLMETLKNANPPVLLKEDVHKYRLLSHAVKGESLEMVKNWIQTASIMITMNIVYLWNKHVHIRIKPK